MTDIPSSYGFYLTADGVTKGFRIIADENGLLRYTTGLAPTLAPQQRLNADNLYEGQPPEVSVTYAAETWTGGAGHVDAPSVGQRTEREAANGYNYTRGIDLSDEYRGYLSPKRNSLLPTSSTILNITLILDGEPIEYLTTSIGTFCITENAIYKWDSANEGWALVDSSGNYRRGSCEFNGNLFVPRGSSPYVYSSDGTTWTASGLTDDNADCFCTRGDDGDASSPTLNVLVKLYDGQVSVNTDGTGNSIQWGAADTIGPSNETAKWVVPADDALLIFKTEGIYRYDFFNVDDIWKAQYLKDDNANYVFQWRNGLFYANYGDRLLEYDPIENTLEYVYPPDSATSQEIKGKITGIAGDDNHMYLTIENHAENTYVMKGVPHGAWHTWAFPSGSFPYEESPSQADVYDHPTGTVTWENDDAILGSYGYASAGSGVSEYLVATNFGFNIPGDAEINGVEVSMNRYSQVKMQSFITDWVGDGDTTTSSSPNPTVSTTLVTNDPPAGALMLVFVYASISGTGTYTAQTVTPPSGWTLVPDSTAGLLEPISGICGVGAIYYRVSEGAEPTDYTWGAGWTVSGSQTRTMSIALQGFTVITDFLEPFALTTVPLTVGQNAAASTNGGSPNSDDSLALAFYGGYFSGATTVSSGPSGMSTAVAHTSGRSHTASYYEDVADYVPPKSISWSNTVIASYSNLLVISPIRLPGTTLDYDDYLWNNTTGTMGTGLMQTEFWPSTPTTQKLGNEIAKWGLSDPLTPAMVNDSNFGFAMVAASISSTAYVNNVTMTIYATIPGKSRPSQAIYVAGPGTIHAENPVVLTGYSDRSIDYILPRAGMRPEDDINYRYETDFGGTTAEAVGSWVDFGASAYPKFLNRGTFLGEGVTAGKYVTLDYQTEDVPGTLLLATQNGLSAENVDGVVAFHRIRYVLGATTTSFSSTPILLGWTVQATLNPPRYRVWSTIVDTSPEGSLFGGSTDYMEDPYDLEDFLYRATTQRVTLQDYRGREFVTRLSDIQPIGLKHYKVGGDDRLAPIYQIQLIEISPISPTGTPLVYGSGAWGQGYEYREA